MIENVELMSRNNSIMLPFLQWRYCVRLENLGEEVVQLRERHWRIFSLSGTLETVRGRGVVGQVRYSNRWISLYMYLLLSSFIEINNLK